MAVCFSARGPQDPASLRLLPQVAVPRVVPWGSLFASHCRVHSAAQRSRSPLLYGTAAGACSASLGLDGCAQLLFDIVYLGHVLEAHLTTAAQDTVQDLKALLAQSVSGYSQDEVERRVHAAMAAAWDRELARTHLNVRALQQPSIA